VTTRSNGQIILGRRDNITVENLLNTTYVFTNKMSLSLRVRHYWSKAAYNGLYALNENGALVNTDFNEFSDDSFNAFTVDAVYRWRFAPGSDLFIVWKNNTENFSDTEGEIQYSYRQGVERLTDFPQRNSLSLRVIYFLDYLSLKRK
jgi:hypothetical protein